MTRPQVLNPSIHLRAEYYERMEQLQCWESAFPCYTRRTGSSQGSGDPVTPDKEIKIVDQLGEKTEQ